MPCYSRLLPADAPNSVTLEEVRKTFVDCTYAVDETIMTQLFDQFKIVAPDTLDWVVKTAVIMYVTGSWDIARKLYNGGQRYINVEGELEMQLIDPVTQIAHGAPAPKLPIGKISKATLTLFLYNFCTSFGWKLFNEHIVDMKKMWVDKASQMVFYTFINRSRFTFARTDECCYKGEFTGMFKDLNMALSTSEGDLVAYGHISSTSGSVSGAASAVTFTATSGLCDPGQKFESFFFVIAGACPIKGRNTLEVRINQSNAKDLADYNDTSGNGQLSFQETVQYGRNAPLNIKAAVEANITYCHVIVEINGSSIAK